MGYYISTPNTFFSIREKNLARFFDLVRNLMSDEIIEKNGRGGSFTSNGKTSSWYSWVNTDLVRRAVLERDILKVFESWGYDLVQLTEVNGSIHYSIKIRDGEAKIGDEEKFFAAIAPVVEDGSFIDARGEDGAEWRWMWENGKFFSQDVVRKDIHFSEPNEIVF
jgi:hypothetical protein